MSRIDRLNSALQESIATYISQEISSPGKVLTVNYILIQPDLKKITVGLTVYPEDNIFLKSVIAKLGKKKSEISLKIAKMHNLKYIPEIVFEEDINPDQVIKMSKLMDETSK